MNAERRKAIQIVIDHLVKIQDMTDTINAIVILGDEEQAYYDCLSESLQASDMASRAQDTVANLQEASEAVAMADDSLGEAIEALRRAL